MPGSIPGGSTRILNSCMGKKRIAIFVHQPYCSVDSANGIILSLSSHYNFKLFSKDAVEDSFFDDVDAVCYPGGLGDADSFYSLTSKNSEAVKNFVAQGGAYLGICMGAYWAGKEYFDILKDIDAVQYITRPGTDTRRPHPKGVPVTWLGQKENMYFYDGCALVGNNMNVVATYSNGDAMAIIQDKIGLIGCHPESEKWWYDLHTWMPRHWHEGRHHKLLLEFVQKII